MIAVNSPAANPRSAIGMSGQIFRQRNHFCFHQRIKTIAAGKVHVTVLLKSAATKKSRLSA